MARDYGKNLFALTKDQLKQFDIRKDEFKKCSCCGERFFLSRGRQGEYAYKRKKSHGKVYWYCSWKCLREKEKK